MAVEDICLPYKHKPFMLFAEPKTSMVICTLYVHITMAKFSALFRHENFSAEVMKLFK